MTAILGGLGAAVMWATVTLTSSRASRQIGAWSVVGWMMLIGLVLVAPLAVAEGVPAHLDRGAAVLLVIGAVGNIAGLLFAYSAFRIGKVGIIAPITAAEGAVAAVIAVAAGETIGRGEGAMLVVIAIGIALAGATGIEAAGLGMRR